MIKNGGENIIKFFHKLCVKIWNEKLWPDDWAKSVFIPIPKKGDTLEQTKSVYLCFIDYRKGFDTIVHEILWHEMKKMGFPTHIIILIKNLNEQQQAAVRTAYGLSERFSIGQGARQGCILSPHLFNIYSEAIMREALDNFEGTIKIGGRTMNNLRYVDDVALIAGSIQELQELVNRVVSKSEKTGLF